MAFESSLHYLHILESVNTSTLNINKQTIFIHNPPENPSTQTFPSVFVILWEIRSVCECVWRQDIDMKIMRLLLLVAQVCWNVSLVLSQCLLPALLCLLEAILMSCKDKYCHYSRPSQVTYYLLQFNMYTIIMRHCIPSATHQHKKILSKGLRLKRNFHSPQHCFVKLNIFLWLENAKSDS